MKPNVPSVEATPTRNFNQRLFESGILRGSIRRTLGAGLMYLVIFEAAVLGSGQLVHVAGPLTLKMLLFALSMLFVLVSLPCGERIRMSALLLVVSYFGSIAFSIVWGLSRDAPLDKIGIDISPALSFLLLPFFEITVRNEKQVMRVIHIIMVASGVITCMYIAIVLSLWTGYVTYANLASWLGSLGPSTGMGDFLFDESTKRVFYKGAIYLAIALIFFLFRRGRWAKIAALFMILNLIAIGARGFFLALFLTGCFYVLIGPIRTTRKVSLILPMVLIGALLLPKLSLLAGDRSESNRVRIVTLNQVLGRTNLATTIVGDGFGFGVPERPEHMEIVPLEIFLKQGLIGLCWWGALFTTLIVRFRSALRQGNAELAYPFFLSSVFIAVESCTNPFINNPIGMTFVTLALTCLSILGSKDTAGEPAGDIAPQRRDGKLRDDSLPDSGEVAFG